MIARHKIININICWHTASVYIVDKIKQCMDAHKGRYGLITIVGHVQFDLTPEGAFLSTKKTLEVVDVNNKRYKITVEEA